jgi:hypothetical protein
LTSQSPALGEGSARRPLLVASALLVLALAPLGACSRDEAPNATATGSSTPLTTAAPTTTSPPAPTAAASPADTTAAPTTVTSTAAPPATAAPVLPTTTTAAPLNRSIAGEVLGPVCADLAELTRAFQATYSGSLSLGQGLRALRCADGWATAWTSPDQADPEQPDPALIVFRSSGGTWTAVATGSAGTCITAGVPEPAQDQLDCY